MQSPVTFPLAQPSSGAASVERRNRHRVLKLQRNRPGALKALRVELYKLQ